MKSLLFTLLLVVSFSVKAQNNAFKINPLGFANNGFELSFESHEPNSSHSSELLIAYASSKSNDGGSNLNVYMMELRYKFYVAATPSTFKGIYIAPVGSYGEARRKSSNRNYANEKANIAALGVLLGYQWKITIAQHNAILIDTHLGFSYYFTKSTPTLNDENSKGVKGRYGISVGYAF